MSALSRGLVADLGGTNARFACADIGPAGEVAIHDLVRLKARDYQTADAAIRAYLDQASDPNLSFVSIACAGPVRDGQVALTNLGWTVSEHALKPLMNDGSTHLLNDLAAVAWAAPRLTPADLTPLAEGREPYRDDVIAVLGVGTGTNCAAYVKGAGAEGSVIVGESGHISFAPNDAMEAKIWTYLLDRYGRVSIERLVSGPGIFNIYQAVCHIEGAPETCVNSEAVSRQADGGDPVAALAIDRFCRVLGAVAGDFVLTFDATAVHIAGGIAPALMCTPERIAAFAQGFGNKGRFRPYVERVSAYVITHPYAALMGAARAASIERRAF